jgi:hypothetical protein
MLPALMTPWYVLSGARVVSLRRRLAVGLALVTAVGCDSARPQVLVGGGQGGDSSSGESGEGNLGGMANGGRNAGTGGKGGQQEAGGASGEAGSDSGVGGSPVGAGIGGAAASAQAGEPGAAGEAGEAGAAGESGAAGGGGTAGGGAGVGGAGSGGAGSGGAGSTGLGGGSAGGSTAGQGGFGGTAVAAPGSFTVNYQLASDVNPNAPGTVGIVTWSSDVAGMSSAHIDFGLDTNYAMRAPVDLLEPGYRTLLLGMKPARAYHFRIAVETPSATYVSADYVINTGPPTTLVPLAAFNVIDETKRERGFIVTSYWFGTGEVPFILDADGEIVWWAVGGPAKVTAARMSADGKNMWMTVPGPTPGNTGNPPYRVSMDTLDSQSYPGTGSTHDFTPVFGDLMAYIDYGELDCPSIFEVDASGASREVWDSEGNVNPDGCHGNALRYSKPRDIYIYSERDQEIFFIDRLTGAITYRLSEHVPGGIYAWGARSHGVDLLTDSLVLLANYGGPDYTVASVEYTLLGQEIQRIQTGLQSIVMGDVQRLPGGNTLISHATVSRIQEFDPSGNLVLEIDGGGSWFGYSLWRPTLYGEPPDIQQ